MKVTPMPAFLAGFCVVAVVMALFLTFPPTEDQLKTAVSQKMGEPTVTVFERHGCSQTGSSEYECYYLSGYSDDSSQNRTDIFTKKDGEWVMG